MAAELGRPSKLVKSIMQKLLPAILAKDLICMLMYQKKYSLNYYTHEVYCAQMVFKVCNAVMIVFIL